MSKITNVTLGKGQRRKGAGRKTRSHGTHRSVRKPNSPLVKKDA